MSAVELITIQQLALMIILHTLGVKINKANVGLLKSNCCHTVYPNLLI